MREYGAEAVTTLVCAALSFDHKPPLVANSVSFLFFMFFCSLFSLRF